MNEEPKLGGGRDTSFGTAREYAELNVEALPEDGLPTKIDKGDIKPHAIGAGETEIVAQRHGQYIRDTEDPFKGSLSPESAGVEKAAARAYFEAFLSQLPEEERAKVDVLFVASDTQYFDGGRRSYETGTLAQDAAQEVFAEMGLPADNIHNVREKLKGEGGPRTMSSLREPNFLNDSPEFMNFLREKYSKDGGLDRDFWVAFEEDKERETRLEMGAEGPDDIADRMHHSLDVLARYARFYHQANPDRRLVVWTATHYDTISPFVKRDVFGVGKEQQLLVDYGAGITIDLDKDGNAKTELGGQEHVVPLKK